MRCALLVGVLISAVAPALAQGPASRPSAQARLKWEKAVIVFGDEDTGAWSLRIRDKDVDLPRQFHFKELWTYDRKTKKWVKVASKPSDTVIAPPPATRKDDKDPSEPNQLLVDLPLDPDAVGLYYARWRIDDVDGSTFFRLGATAPPGSTPEGKRPAGSMQASVPVDKTHSVADFIPDPRIACEKDEGSSSERGK